MLLSVLVFPIFFVWLLPDGALVSLLQFLGTGMYARVCHTDFSASYAGAAAGSAACIPAIHPALMPLALMALLQLFLCDGLHRTLQDQWSLLLALLGAADRLLQAPNLPQGIESLSRSLALAEAVFALWLASALMAATLKAPLPLGMGDAKLTAAAALLLGSRLLQALITASLLSGLWCALLLALKRIEKRDRIAFGPFLVIGFLSCLQPRLC